MPTAAVRESTPGGTAPRHCGACHPPESEPGQLAQVLYDEITTAARAFEEAEDAITTVRRLGMLVGPLEGQLRAANTSLVTARAAQHTLDVDTVRRHADEVRTVADQVKADAEAAKSASLFRRQAMVIAVAAIGLTITSLYFLKRELDRQLEAEL